MNDYLGSDAVWRSFVFGLEDYAIVMLDPDGFVIALNKGASVIKGYAADEITGKHFSHFYPPEAVLLGHPARELAMAISLGRYEEEGWRVRKDGSRFWAHVVICPIYDDAQCLRGFGKVLRDFTERKQASEQSLNVMRLLEMTARSDYLTGLDNRRSFDAALTKEIASARRHERPISIAMLDLDRFKTYNDEFGHQAGDAYLRLASNAWRRALRPEDFIGRYGGEEFVVLLPGATLEDAVACLDRARTQTPAPLTCSIGVAEWDRMESANDLIGRADRALYDSKKAGRDRITRAT